MASQVAYDTIKAAVVAAVTPTPVYDWDEVDPEENQSDVAWIALEEDPASEDPISLGDPTSQCTREEGEITVHVFSPAAGGIAGARQIADTIRKSIRWRSLSQTTRALQCDPGLPGIIRDGRWTSVETAIAYQHDTYEDITT